MTTFKLPDLGEGLQEAEIVSVNVNDGDNVVVDQPLLSVETEKAVVEIPSPESGQIAKVLVKAGSVVPVGAALIEFVSGDKKDSGTVVGAVPDMEAPKQPSVQKAAPKETPKPKHVKASPAVRRMAKEMGVDLSIISPTGPKGTITRADLTVISGGASASKAPAPSGPPPAGFEPLKGVRKAMAKQMAKTHAEVVPASLHDIANIHSWYGKGDVTARLIRAMVVGCKAEPTLNAWYQNEGLKYNDKVDIGVAVDSKDGLFVPALRDAHKYSEDGLREKLEEIKNGIINRTIPPSEMTGYTIMLSNFGAIWGRHGAMVLATPCVAIIGAGRVREDVVAKDGMIAVQRVLPLSLTFDHRAVTGGEAARFMKALILDLQKDD